MQGKLCIVTGANSGIGKAMATDLAQRGAEVILVCRNPARAEVARQEICRTTRSERFTVELCDLGEFASVRALAARLRAQHGRIDVLANNAGLYLPSRQLSPDGFESMLAINHLGPFLLTHLLGDRLDGARVVTTSSIAHAIGRIGFDNLQGERRFIPIVQYGVTKLANILFTRELARRGRDRGVVATCFHPGAVATEFGQDEPGVMATVMRVVAPYILRTAAKGAETGIWLATDPAAAAISGSYCQDRRVRTPWSQGANDAIAAELWRFSERATGLPPAAMASTTPA
jgi:NAD(P)-dependent dehydrogenase (short-subunit alcohol dehydrogenase family)